MLNDAGACSLNESTQGISLGHDKIWRACVDDFVDDRCVTMIYGPWCGDSTIGTVECCLYLLPHLFVDFREHFIIDTLAADGIDVDGTYSNGIVVVVVRDIKTDALRGFYAYFVDRRDGRTDGCLSTLAALCSGSTTSSALCIGIVHAHLCVELRRYGAQCDVFTAQ